MPEDEHVPTAEYESLDQLRISKRYLDNQERYRISHGLHEEELHLDLIRRVEEVVGPLLDWQKVYFIAAVSGRGVEWAQTRRGSHFHIVDLPCAVCSGSRGVGMY